MRVIVTGAAQGIGECVARMLAKDGHALALADIQEEKVAAVASELGARPVRVDIADPASCLAMIAVAQQQLGGLDANRLAREQKNSTRAATGSRRPMRIGILWWPRTESNCRHLDTNPIPRKISLEIPISIH